jgi:hypothetical protein
MGTNYYVVENVCECCKRYDEKYHIGKKSYGWAFSFRGYKYDGLTTWQRWKEYLADKIIYDEYGERISFDQFVELIEVYGRPGYVHVNEHHPNGHQVLVHSAEGRKKGWFNSEYDWDDPEGYSFSSREFS